MPKAFLKSKFFNSQAHVLRHLEYLAKQSPLFSGGQEAPLPTALATAEQYENSIKWWFVFGLQEEDAARLEIDRSYMKELVQKNKNAWAAAYNIPPERLHVYVSYHEIAHHPHLHVVLFGETASDGYIVQREGQSQGDAFKRCRETVKSSIANDIFRGDLEMLKKEKGQQRSAIEQQLQHTLLEIGKNTHPVKPALSEAFQALTEQLQQLPGKHQYGYLPPELKEQVDALLEQMVETDGLLGQLYNTYAAQQKDLVGTYATNKQTIAEKMANWEASFFHPTKGKDTRRHNLIIQAADQLAGTAREHNKKNTEFDENSIFAPESLQEEVADLQGPATDAPEVLEQKEAAAIAKEVEKLEIEAVRQLEQEWSGRLPKPVAAMLQDIGNVLNDPDYRSWKRPAHLDQLEAAALSLLEKEYPFLSSAAIQAALLQHGTPTEALSGMKLLQYKLEQYARYVKDDCVDINALKAEKLVSRYRSNFSSALQRELVATLDTTPTWMDLATDLQALPRTPKNELPGYQDVPQPLQGRVNELICLCWNEPAVRQAAAALAEKLGAEDEQAFYEQLLNGKKGRSFPSAAQRAAVKALLTYTPFPLAQDPVAKQAATEPPPVFSVKASAPQDPGVASGNATPADTPAPEERYKKEDMVDASPQSEEDKQLIGRNVRFAVEQELLKNVPQHMDIGGLLLEIQALANPQTGVLPYHKMPQKQKELVDRCVKTMMEWPAAHKAIQETLRSLHQGYDPQILEDLCDAEKLNVLHKLVVDYAGAATAEQPISTELQQNRRAEYKILCALDAALCKTLNAPADAPERLAAQALISQIYQPRRTPREKAEYEPPAFYGQLPPIESNSFDIWFKQLCTEDKGLQAAIKERCAERSAEWFDAFLKKSNKLQNLAVSRLLERYQDPDKTLKAKFEFTQYKHKTLASAVRSLLYSIGKSLNSDTQRTQNQNRSATPDRNKLHKKMIHKQTIAERSEEIER